MAPKSTPTGKFITGDHTMVENVHMCLLGTNHPFVPAAVGRRDVSNRRDQR